MRHLCAPAAMLFLAWSAAGVVALEPLKIALAKHTAPNAQSVAISPDGKFIAAAFGGPSNGRFPLQPTTGGVAVFQRDTGERVSFAGQYGDIVSLQFVADGKSLLYGRVYTPGDSIDDNLIGAIDTATGEKLQPTSHFGSASVCAASPTAEFVLFEKGTDILHLTSLADLRRGKRDGTPLKFDDSYSARCVGFSPDGETFAAVHGRTEPLLDATGAVRPNARRIANKCLTIWDADMLHVRGRIVSDELSDCLALSVAPHGQWIATGHKSGVVRIWDPTKREPIHKLTVAAAGYVRPLFSPAGDELAVLAQTTTVRDGIHAEVLFYETMRFTPVRQWQFADGELQQWHANRPPVSLNPERIAYSPDGKQLLIGAGGASLIDIATGEVVRQFGLK